MVDVWPNPAPLPADPPRRPDRRHKRVHTDALEQLTDAVLAAEHLGDVADHLVGHFVDQARRSGASWTDIGRSMGVTKQAAQKRFVPKAPSGPDARPREGFGRFTPRARNVVVAAHNEARAAPQRRDPPRPPRARPARRARRRSASRRSRRSGVTLDACGPPWRRPSAAGGDAPELVPYDAAAKALELTFREALRLGHNYVGTEHMLLALLELEGGDGALGAGPHRPAAEAVAASWLGGLSAPK